MIRFAGFLLFVAAAVVSLLMPMDAKESKSLELFGQNYPYYFLVFLGGIFVYLLFNAGDLFFSPASRGDGLARVAGVVALLAALYFGLYRSDPNNKAIDAGNLIDVFNRQGFLMVLTLGVAVLIITGAIDLSIGSLVGLSSVSFGVLIFKGLPGIGLGPQHPYVAMLLVLMLGVVVGTLHGLLVTKLRLQPFLVTLCGLFLYRGAARYLIETPVGFQKVITERPDIKPALDSMRFALIGKDADGRLLIPMMIVVAFVLAELIAILLHNSVYGRYWYAIGYNESAAKYSGIKTDRHRISCFVISSTLACLGGMLFFLDIGEANPTSAGVELELYAITGAVLGGCSLRGGEGTILGMLLGAAVLPILKNLLSFLEIRDAVIPIIIGITLLSGTIVDEMIRRRAGKRK